jgi:hypothetical protein
MKKYIQYSVIINIIFGWAYLNSCFCQNSVLNAIKKDTIFLSKNNELGTEYCMENSINDPEIFIYISPKYATITIKCNYYDIEKQYIISLENHNVTKINLENLPNEIIKFIPLYKIKLPENNRFLWYNSRYLVVTDSLNNFVSYKRSPFFNYIGKITPGNLGEYYDVALVGNSLIFPCYTSGDYREMIHKASDKIPPYSKFIKIDYNELYSNDSIFNNIEIIAIDNGLINISRDSEHSVRPMWSDPLNNYILYNDPSINSIVKYDLNHLNFENRQLPQTSFLNLKNFIISNRGYIISADSFIKHPNITPKKPIGIIYESSLTCISELNKCCRVSTVGIFNNETAKLMHEISGNKIDTIKHPSDKSFAIYQFLSLESDIKIVKELIVPINDMILVTNIKENSITGFKLIKHNSNYTPAIITWHWKE